MHITTTDPAHSGVFQVTSLAQLAHALAEALKTNSTLITMDLQKNSIGDNGVQSLAEALKTNSSLAILDLQYNTTGDKGAQAQQQVSQCMIEY
ncbi:hypothetical protein MVEG_11015 [Podila verticillata NRRL 6337]|uniref:Uncharacterized protein n=1 Tax=Podila verticillata NRRL 6337 TaxID=1069443 RepID=A0A086TM00_9FUNG|nr:hypothetical protein MVEG_11015 [Podila verticillata NRRL 6337]